MASVDWTDQALDEIDLIVAYIELFDPAAAARIGARLVDLGDSLADFHAAAVRSPTTSAR
jgi:plasmid stabilization system protein ParE